MSTENFIDYDGAIALSQCLTHLTQLTQLYLRGACVHIDVLLGALCDVWCGVM